MGLSSEVENRIECPPARDATHLQQAIIQAIASSAALFLHAANLQTAVHAFLERLGVATDVSRISLLSLNTLPQQDNEAISLQCRSEWIAPTISPHVCFLNILSYQQARVAAWQTSLRCGIPMQGNTQTFSVQEQMWLADERVLSVLTLPIFVNGQWWGCLDIVDGRFKRLWSQHELDALTMAVDVLAAALERQWSEAVSKAQQKELRKLHRAVEQSPHPIVITDVQGIIEYINPSFTQVTGYTFAEAVGNTPRILKSGKTEPEEYENLWQTVTSGNIWRGVFYNKRKDGHCYWDEATIYPITDTDGTITHFLSIKEDVTDRKRVEKALHIQRDLAVTLSSINDLPGALRCLLQAIFLFEEIEVGWVFIVEKETNDLKLVAYEGISPRFAASNEYLSVSSKFAQLVMTRRAPLYLHHADTNANTSGVVLCPDARTMLILPIRHEDRMIAVLHVGSRNHEDIPVSTRTALESIAAQMGEIIVRVEAEEALRASEERFRLLAEHAQDIIFRYHFVPAPRFEYMSPAVLAILGYAPEAFYADADLLGKIVHPEDRPLVECFKHTPERLPEPLTLRYIHHDGTLVWIEQRHRLLQDEAQRPLAIEVFSRDITDRKRIEETLKQERSLLEQKVQERTSELSNANEELARSARLKDEFLSSVSHELRTPLNAVIGLSEALIKQAHGTLNEQQLEYLEMIEQSGQRLKTLINTILDFSKLQAGKEQLTMTPINISNVCQASLHVVKSKALEKNIQLSLSIAETDMPLVADERRLKQILVHLLDNAVKFTLEGGSVGLEVNADHEQQLSRFIVWDTGIGISRQNMQNLFKLFQQLDGCLSRQYGGVGLGLAFVARLIHMHHGSIRVESEVGQGSRFEFTLPWNKKVNDQ
jgi:PAS domain S-box-containing protein